MSSRRRIFHNEGQVIGLESASFNYCLCRRVNILALASVISQPIFSLYPNANFPFPKFLQAEGNESETQVNEINILWSRVGGFDNSPGFCFAPNHFVPVAPRTEHNDKKKKQ